MAASEDHENRKRAKALVNHGASALPFLEAGLTSIEYQGSESPYAVNANWLMLAYAGILGPKAQLRIADMIGAPVLHYWASALDRSMALAMGLTSYLSNWRDLPCPPNELECRVSRRSDIVSTCPDRDRRRRPQVSHRQCGHRQTPRDDFPVHSRSLGATLAINGYRRLIAWCGRVQRRAPAAVRDRRAGGEL